MDPVWYRRFADIPGVQYEAPAGLTVSKLKKRNAVPEINRFSGSSSLWWATADGGTSQSPSREHAVSDMRGVATDVITRNLAEALELPGEASDYHFALQNAAGELYGRRRESDAVLDEVEHLHLLDLQLIQACPEAITWERDGQTNFYQVGAFTRLLRLYLTEGGLADALSVAEIAERFGAGSLPDVLRARERAAALMAEDV